MHFLATPLNVATLLVILLGICAEYLLWRKRFDSNVLLFFYLAVLAFANWTDRHVNGSIYGSGFVLALLLRFEFMNAAFTRLILALEILVLAAINLSYLGQAFNVELPW
jgi:hypothetical protein